MNLPVWQERCFEGRTLKVTPLGPEEETVTRIGTRWGVPARVEVLSGLFTGQVYDRVLLFSSALKAQLEDGPVQGRLARVTGRNRIGRGWALLGES